MTFPIIDLFAGPGGLGEGFSLVLRTHNQRAFKIVLSIEKDLYAHRTLLLRAFFRQFAAGNVPGHYYDYLSGRLSTNQLFSLYKHEADAARVEAWQAELGNSATPDSVIDQRIQTALGKQRAWLLIGGPPCQAYSLVGRSRIRGASKEQYENDHRHYLYREYLRILAVHQPLVFVMENVKGLLSATVKGQPIFRQILRDLQRPIEAANLNSNPVTYRLFSIVKTPNTLFGEFEPEEFVVRAEEFGVPQARHRIIILGIRQDISLNPRLLTPSPSPSIADVIGDLPKLRSVLSKEADSGDAWRSALHEIKNTEWFLSDTLAPDLRSGIVATIRQLKSTLNNGRQFHAGIFKPRSLSEWFFDPCLNGIANHVSRGHIREDLQRYLFAAIFAKKRGRSPLLEDFPSALLPNHLNVNQALLETKFNDRFRVQLRNRPSTTIVSHIAKDGHYFIHYDASQCRSLTVREAARLQTFPDNYYFEGPRTEQYRQVGNAVPPFLAHQLGEIIADLFERYDHLLPARPNGRTNSATA